MVIFKLKIKNWKILGIQPIYVYPSMYRFQIAFGHSVMWHFGMMNLYSRIYLLVLLLIKPLINLRLTPASINLSFSEIYYAKPARPQAARTKKKQQHQGSSKIFVVIVE